MMQQITGNIYQVALGPVNVFVIEDDGLTLIDTGYKGSAHKLFHALQKAGKKPSDIKRIILTHCHPDHAGGAAEIKKQLDVPVFAHTEDAQLIEQGIAGRYPIQLSPGIINWLILNLFIKRAGVTIKPVGIEEKLEDNDLLPFAGGIRVIHTPGHSAGHIALWIKNAGVLIAGDICANIAGLGLSTVYENRETGIKSILKAASFNFDIAVFGHGKPLRNAPQKLNDKFLIRTLS